MITALLGPTNTGKTHRAIERMLEHDSGVIGVPLRLLAREVYDKLTARVGERRVALVTGEEKRVPAQPSYWVCTVEAMPPDLSVDFLAIDEVQLAAHDQRGHVFTDRLLRARGKKETWFLGAETIRPVIQRLVPDAHLARLPRLSRLTSAGANSLAGVPARSALVAFSAEKVFELAERIRARKGGAAVVLGVLSPRTRNAQVAMYQSGEVDYLVATDAIGMGLNLDVRHVAFAAIRKFDGREARELDPAEVGQIAGRAGRHTRDGTFGTLAPLELPRDVIRAVESHRFSPITHVRWRSADLDFSGIDALISSLRTRPDQDVLRLDDSGEDLAALVALASFPEVRERAGGPEAVRLLWDVCRVPDYRKLLFESHVALLAMLFVQLVEGPLDPLHVEARIREIDDERGDIDTLTARLSAIRTWSYVANQPWLRDARRFQESTREVEDRLSDALHAKLVQRFVERTSKRVVGGRAIEVPRAPRVDPSHPFARLASLRAELAGEPPPAAEDWAERLIDAPHAAFAIDARGGISFDGRHVATLIRGATLLTPDVRLSSALELAPGARSRVLRRLVAVARDVVDDLLAPLRAVVGDLAAPGRGIVYQLEQSLGTVLSRDARAQLDAAAEDERRALAAAGVRLGRCVTFLPSRGDAQLRRVLLATLFFEGAPGAPRPGAVSFSAHRADPRACLAMGFPVFARRAVRADVAEAVYGLVKESPRPPQALASRLGCPAREVPAVVDALLAE
ncbi:MAG: helicase [Deltaproteobacteria bacterium]|nr:helicase [Deltaproteobacteria bacterium]